MSYKSMLLALLVLTLSGCAVYGDGSGYGHRGYDRGHSNTYYQVQRYPVYVVPQPQRYKAHQHDGRRYDDHRHPSRYYVPAPQPRHYQTHKYQKRHDYRVVQPQAGWDGRRDHYRNHQQRAQRHDAQWRGERRGDDRRDERKGWERQRN
ncbi:conserved exported hypothetical protein [Pseudomonas sp. 8BK]|uniref:hypothetical protein n=1 Tax=Pseudomonas sp. 8BK TaxID=2653164 RepID=UPI0012F3EFD6|nr:hypothetical protein [Pseudomonas sp. 8BK]VXB26543.1 conserved exported hypothetical protein [Pseudomonas sp. 8BK]